MASSEAIQMVNLTAAAPNDELPTNRLRRTLNSWQIFMIVISTTIGTGFFVSSGEMLAIAGPASTILAFALVGIIAWFTMEGLAHMTMMWPVPNPMVEFTSTFVDEDLGTVVCFTYWYSCAISVAAVTTTAGDIAQYWGGGTQGTVIKVGIFIFFPILILLVNYNNVELFGWIETVGGILKLLIVTMIFLTMLAIDWGAGNEAKNMNLCIKAGFKNDSRAVDNPTIATVLAISLAVFPYLGVESFTVTAFEAKDQTSLRPPAKLIAPIVACVYILSVLGFVLNVSWENGYLPAYYNQWKNSELSRSYTCHSSSKIGERATGTTTPNSISHTIAVIAIDQARISGYGSFINVCLLYSALSTANSLFFVASRTLYGYGRSRQDRSWFSQNGSYFKNKLLSRIHNSLRKFPAKFGHVNSFQVPPAALIASLFFIWTPFLSLGTADNYRNTQQTLISIGSTGCVLVWACQSLAYLRMHSLFRKNHTIFEEGDLQQYDVVKWNRNWTYLGFAQPFVAVASLVSCLVIVLILASAGMWNHKGDIKLKALNTYLGPVLFVLLYLFLKWRRRSVSDGWATCETEDDVRAILKKLRDKILPTTESKEM